MNYQATPNALARGCIELDTGLMAGSVDSLARRALALMEGHGDDVGPTDAVRMLPEYDAMTPEQRGAVTERTKLLCIAFSDPPPLTEADAGPYSLKNYQAFRSPDGGGMNATLYRSNRKVAEVHDAGNGGGMEYHFTSRADEDAFDAYLTGLDSLAWWRTGTYNGQRDGFISGLETLLGRQKQITRYVRKMRTHAVLFRAPARLSTIPLNGHPFNAMRDRIAAAHPDAVLLNTLPEAEARALIGQWYDAADTQE